MGRGYKRKYPERKATLIQMNTTLEEQNYVDAKALAASKKITVGILFDRLIKREVRRRQKKMELNNSVDAQSV